MTKSFYKEIDFKKSVFGIELQIDNELWHTAHGDGKDYHLFKFGWTEYEKYPGWKLWKLVIPCVYLSWAFVEKE